MKVKIVLPPACSRRKEASSSREKVDIEATSKYHLAFAIDLKTFDDSSGSRLEN